MARKFENPFYKILVFSPKGFDSGLKVKGKPVILPPGKKGTVTDLPEVIREAQRVGNHLELLGLMTVKQLDTFFKDGTLVITELEGIMSQEEKEDPKDKGENEEEAEEEE